MSRDFDRRSFVKGFAIAGAAAIGGSSLTGCTSDGGKVNEAIADSSAQWDAEYDVVVVGFGGAGAVAAKTAADEGARVLLTEKASKADAGGNSKVCSQLVIYGHGDEEGTYDYYKALAGDFPIDEDVLKVYANGIAHIWDLFSEAYGLDKSEFVEYMYPEEYPELPGAGSMNMTMLHDGMDDGYIYSFESQAVLDRSDLIDVWYSSPATRLITDSSTGAVLGVEIDHDGRTVLVKANGGVVLACGGYENNQQMVCDYLGLTNYSICGSSSNTGDGIKLAISAGADLWHMRCYESMGMLGGVGYKAENGVRSEYFFAPCLYSGSIMLVGTAGYRYLREDEGPRHGHMYSNGVWDNVKHPHRVFLIFDQVQYDTIVKSGAVDDKRLELVVEANTIGSLGELIGMEEGVLQQTVSEFNKAAGSGVDTAFHRDPATMAALSESGPYYALELTPNILNTQGGPRRNADAQVVGIEGRPIPHLFAAGECGGVTVNQYQGGGNMADNIIFGQIAGRNAAANKPE